MVIAANNINAYYLSITEVQEDSEVTEQQVNNYFSIYIGNSCIVHIERLLSDQYHPISIYLNIFIFAKINGFSPPALLSVP